MTRINWTNEKLFTRLLNNKTKKTYWENIRELRSRPTKDVFNKCKEFIKNDSPKKRNIAIDILAQFGAQPRQFQKEINFLFFEQLEKEKNIEVITSTLYAIGHNNEKLTSQQIKKLCEFQSSENNSIKQSLVSALGFINNLKVIDVLIKLSEDKSSSIRNWSTFYIAQGERSTKKIVKALWKRLKDKHQETSYEAIVGLAKRKIFTVKDFIKIELIKGEFGSLLLDAALEIGDEEILNILKNEYQSFCKNKNVNSVWLIDLKKCIMELSQKLNS